MHWPLGSANYLRLGQAEARSVMPLIERQQNASSDRVAVAVSARAHGKSTKSAASSASLRSVLRDVPIYARIVSHRCDRFGKGRGAQDADAVWSVWLKNHSSRHRCARKARGIPDDGDVQTSDDERNRNTNRATSASTSWPNSARIVTLRIADASPRATIARAMSASHMR